MVSSSGAPLEGILGGAGLAGGWGVALGPGQGREIPRAEEGPRRPRGSWGPPREGPGLEQVPGGVLPPVPGPGNAGAGAGDLWGTQAGLLGEGQGTGSHGPGSGGGRELAEPSGRRGLGCVCVLWRLCCCKRARLFF